MVIHLGVALLRRSSDTPGGLGRVLRGPVHVRRTPGFHQISYELRRTSPTFDLAPGGVYRPPMSPWGARELLPHAFTLTPRSAAFTALGRRSTLCGTFPGVTPAGRYPAPRPCGARTFLPQPSLTTSDHPVHSLYTRAPYQPAPAPSRTSARHDARPTRDAPLTTGRRTATRRPSPHP